jgi:hypothetical protein
MTINNIFQFRRIIIAAVALPMLSLLLNVSALAGEEGFRLTNVDWWIERDEIVVSYDLEGDANESYVVTIVLKRQSDPLFKFKLATVVGKMGEGKFAGKNNEIRWKYKSDAPQGFSGSDYFFQVSVDRPKGFPWLYVAGGALAAGIAVAVLAGKKTETPGTETGLPNPPAHP